MVAGFNIVFVFDWEGRQTYYKIIGYSVSNVTKKRSIWLAGAAALFAEIKNTCVIVREMLIRQRRETRISVLRIKYLIKPPRSAASADKRRATVKFFNKRAALRHSIIAIPLK